jgi:hypothetical protein
MPWQRRAPYLRSRSFRFAALVVGQPFAALVATAGAFSSQGPWTGEAQTTRHSFAGRHGGL